MHKPFSGGSLISFSSSNQRGTRQSQVNSKKMFGFRKPAPNNQQNLVGRRTTSDPANIPNIEEDAKRGAKKKQKDALSDSEDFDSMSVQELETYAVKKSEDTTKTVNNCLRIAEDIREDATRTLDTLHQQGEQIHRTHVMATDIDKDLSKGEKLLNNLGGMFSMPWKPKKTREIKGPETGKDEYFKEKASKEQREKLGLAPNPKAKAGSRTSHPEPTNAMQKVEMEKEKQDDGLDDLSDILGDLKGMAVDMGTELEKQNKALDHLYDDVDELNNRVKGANQRARKLVGK